jgi:hypothetical protein
MTMKLYDVIRKDHKAKGQTDLDKEFVIPVPKPSPRRKAIIKAEKEIIEEVTHLSSRWKKILVITLCLLFIAGLYLIGIYVVHATVTVTERQIPFSLFDTRVEVANEKNVDPGRLSFQTMTVTDSVTRVVFGSALTTSTTKAGGQAVIFNQYSTRSQTIRSGTTLTATNGQKYVTQASVSVPGYTGSGSAKVAGSATVDITATGVGTAYNSAGTTFTVSGYSGANAKTFYATSAGAITGGQNGAMHTLSDTDKQQTLATLQAALAEKLLRETRAQIPDTLVTFPTLQFTSIDDTASVMQGSTIQFPVTLKGTMVSYLLPRDGLQQAIASKAISDHLYPHVSIPDLGAVHIDPISPLPADASNIPQSITLSVSGQGTIITKVPIATVRQAVLGISRRAFTAALSDIPEIDTARYTLSPFWAPYFPYKPDRITIKVQ